MQAASDECGHRGIVLKTSMTRMHRISITTMEHGVLIFFNKKKSGCTLVPPKTQLSHSSGWDDSVPG